MASKSIGDLAVKITADTTKFAAGLDKAKRETDTFSTKLKHSFAGAAKGAAMLTAGFAAVGGAVALAISKALDYADAIGKAADQSGVTTDRIQEMRYAFGFFGLSVEQSDKALQDFNRKLGEFTATGSGEGKIAFEALDISVKNLDGSLKSTEEVLDEAYNKLGRIEDPAQRAALAVKLFGEEAGPRIANAVGKGSDAIKKLRREAHELGLVMDNETIRGAEEVNDQLKILSDTLRMNLLNALTALMPTIKEFVNYMTSPEVKQGIKEWGEAVADSLKWIIENKEEIASAAKVIAAMWAGSKVAGPAGAIAAGTFTWGFGKGGELYDALNDTQKKVADLDEQMDKSFKTSEEYSASLSTMAKNGLADTEAYLALEKARNAELENYNKLSAERLKLMPPKQIEINGGKEDKGGQKNPFTPSGSAGVSAVEKEAKRLETLARKYKDLIDPIQRYRDELNEVEMLYAKGKLTQDERLEALMNINDAIDEQIDKTDELTEAEKKAKDAAAEFGDIMTSAFEDAILAGGDFGDVLQGLAEDILRLMLRQNVTKPLAEAIGGIDFGSLLSGLFSSGKAGGGRVYPGSIQPVGERGPELFVPDGPGTIMPNYLLGGSGSGGGNVNIEIINQGTAQTVTGQSQSQDAAGMVIQLMLDDLNTGGKISQGYTRAFGLRRGGG